MGWRDGAIFPRIREETIANAGVKYVKKELGKDMRVIGQNRGRKGAGATVTFSSMNDERVNQMIISRSEEERRWRGMRGETTKTLATA